MNNMKVVKSFQFGYWYKYIYTLNSVQWKNINCGSFMTIDKDQLQVRV